MLLTLLQSAGGGGGPTPVGSFPHFWAYISSLSYTGAVNDKLRAHLTAQGYNTGSVVDDLYKWFLSLGYAGTIPKMIRDWEDDYLL